MSHTTTSPAPPMKDMLKDMYEMVDSVLDNQGIGHAESLETLQKKSNAKFLQLNICLMMRAFQSVIADQPADTPCKECHEELKEENDKLKEEIVKLQEHLDKSREVSNKLIAENNTTMPSQSALYRENNKLKAELNDFTSVFDGNVSMIKMKKENEQLKYELADVQEEKYALYLKWSDLNDENKNIIHELNESSDCMLKMKEENEKLKQGIKDLFLSFD